MRKLIIKNKIQESADNNQLTFNTSEFSEGRFVIFAQKSGEGAGYIEIAPLQTKEKAVFVQQIMIPEEFQRQKIGTKLYELAVKEAAKRGNLLFCSDEIRTPESEAFWQKQFSKGRAKKENAGGPYGTRYCLNLLNISQVDLSEDV